MELEVRVGVGVGVRVRVRRGHACIELQRGLGELQVAELDQ